jgi:hypothetical protein
MLSRKFVSEIDLVEMTRRRTPEGKGALFCALDTLRLAAWGDAVVLLIASYSIFDIYPTKKKSN